MAYDIGPKIGIDGEVEFRKAIQGINDNLKTLGTEMKVAMSEFDKGDKSVDALSKQNDVLNKQIDEQKNKLDELQKGLSAASEKYGENDKVTQGWQRAVNQATADLNNMERQLDNNSDAIEKANKPTEDLAENVEDFGENADKAGENAMSMGDIIKANLISEAIIGGIKALGSAMVSVATGILDTVESTKEYRGDLAKLQQNADDAGLSMDSMKDKLANLTAITGETDSSIEGLSNLMAAGLGEEGMAQAVDALSGAIVKFPDTLKFESLSDSLQETIKTGEGSGQFVELLGRMGMDTEAFSESLAACTTESERQELALKALADTGLAEVNKQYQETNEAMISAEEAQFRLDDAIASFAANIEPAVSTIKGGLADVLANLVGVINGDEEAIDNLGVSVNSLVQDFLKMAKEAIPAVQEVLKELIPTIIDAVIEALPDLIDAGLEIIQAVIDGLTENLPLILDAGLEIIMKLIEALIENLPQIVESALEIIVSLAEGIAEYLPELIPAIVDTVITIVETLIDNVDKLVDAAIEIIIALAEGLIEALPRLIEKIPVIIEKLVAAIIKNHTKIAKAGIELIVVLGEGLIEAIPKLVKQIPQIVTAITKGIGEGLSSIKDVGKNLVQGLWNGINDATAWIVEKVKGFGGSVLNAIKGFFGIHSPSTVFRDEVGKYLAEGLGEGFVGEMDNITKDMNDSIPTDFEVDGVYNMSTNSISGIDAEEQGIYEAFASVANDIIVPALKSIGMSVQINPNAKGIFSVVTNETNRINSAIGTT